MGSPPKLRIMWNVEPEIKQKGYRDMDRNHVKKIQTRKSIKKKIFPLKIINYEKYISKEGYQKKDTLVLYKSDT